jgi:hypothetical protein
MDKKAKRAKKDTKKEDQSFEERVRNDERFASISTRYEMQLYAEFKVLDK